MSTQTTRLRLAWSIFLLVVLVACRTTQPEAEIPPSTAAPSVVTTSVPRPAADAGVVTTAVPAAPTASAIRSPSLPSTSVVPGSTPTLNPTATPPPPSATPTATTVVTPTPDIVAGFTIPDFRNRDYGEGEITIGDVWQRGVGYTSYRISYPVDGLRLTGLLHVPDGDGPFPLIIANRGTIARDIYQPGMDSRAFSDLMARQGFLVVAPDFRGYGGGDDGPNPFYTGY
jgi:uncharacterized protein